MKTRIRHFWITALPFLVTLGLWRLSAPLWNPGGILAIIPIFYYSFIRPTPWFAPYAGFICFLIDYKSDTVLYWTALYCTFYAANGFQNFIDLTRWDRGGVRAFAIFISIAIGILFFSQFTLANAMRMAWMGAWTCVLYTPIIAILRGHK